ncbi:MAG TPA: STAS domain-containing protein [Ilumatobacteraceae bacterium]|nr:STAS domain-containing protein [Ilumatobacteraceae bacterium]
MTKSDQPVGEEFVVRRVDDGREVLLELTGELDVAGIDRVSEAAEQLPPHAHVTIDLSQLSFMDSSGIRVLMSLDLRSRTEQWTLTLRAPQPQVLNALKLCGFEDRFEITP